MTPRVSVLICAYELGHFLPAALDSALAQEWPADALEIIVVDDGSTDDTPAILQDYAARGVIAIHQENRGLVGAVDRGLRAVTGDYVALLDADDLWPADRVARQVAHLEAHPRVGLVHGDMELIDEHGRTIQASFEATQAEPPTSGRVLGRLLGGNFVSGGASMFRASLLPALLPISPDAAYPDWWIAACVAAVAEIDHLPGIHNRYRRHAANMGLGAGAAQMPDILRREIPWRRWMLSHLLGEATVTLGDLRRAHRAWEHGLLVAAAGRGVRGLVAVAPEDAACCRAMTARGVAARPHDVRGSAVLLLGALAHDPWDGAARLELELTFAAAEPAIALAPVPISALPARGVVTLAWAAELADDPGLLTAYGACTGADDDATLVVITRPDEEDRLVAAAGVAGFTEETSADVLAVAPPATPPATAWLLARAGAVLSAAAPRPYAALARHTAIAVTGSLAGVR